MIIYTIYMYMRDFSHKTVYIVHFCLDGFWALAAAPATQPWVSSAYINCLKFHTLCCPVFPQTIIIYL